MNGANACGAGRLLCGQGVRAFPITILPALPGCLRADGAVCVAGGNMALQVGLRSVGARRGEAGRRCSGAGSAV